MRLLPVLLVFCGLSLPTRADVSLSSVFTDHMVLQRNQENPVWGWASPGEKITVTIGEQSHAASAGEDGSWRVALDSLPAGGPHILTVKGNNTVKINDVLVGEVWVCSGQSNMQWPVSASDDADIERLTANYPQIRLLTVPRVGTQTPQRDFSGSWQVCTPAAVDGFSAVGYYFGRQLHNTLNVPIGLIDNAWGGSAAEAWIERDRLESDERYAGLLKRWDGVVEKQGTDPKFVEYDEAVNKWTKTAAAAREAGQPVPEPPRIPRHPLTGQQRPSNLYNGVLKPILGYGIRGVIWYQGESNAGRAYRYRDLFPLLISSWREDWGQGDFPFYWVQLADFLAEQTGPENSSWAELREAQTMTLDLPNTGQAVITDLGEASDIHPRDKQNVAKRLARLALSDVYGYKIVSRSPRYESMMVKDGKIRITFQDVGDGLDTFDTRDVQGFTIAGDDQKFVPAMAKIVSPTEVEVWSDAVTDPVAVRYSWANNPVANLQNKTGLPVTPFRTDDWDGITKGVE